MAKSKFVNYKMALAHAEEIREQRVLKKMHEQAKLAAQKQKEREEEKKRKLIELQKDCTNLYTWIVYPEEYHMETGVVWANNSNEAEQKIRNMFPNAIRYIVKNIDVNCDVVCIASYIE